MLTSTIKRYDVAVYELVRDFLDGGLEAHQSRAHARRWGGGLLEDRRQPLPRTRLRRSRPFVQRSCRASGLCRGTRAGLSLLPSR